jgi:hypothetical protein
MENPKEEPKQKKCIYCNNKGYIDNHTGSARIDCLNCDTAKEPKQETNKTYYLDELPNMNKDVLLKMWNAAVPKLEPKQEILEQETCNFCDKTLREQVKGCSEITCYRQFLPKQETTLEEVAEKYWKMQYIMALDESTKPYIIQDFIAGYKLAQEQNKKMYSEEEVKSFLDRYRSQFRMDKNINIKQSDFIQWFEQFKKK